MLNASGAAAPPELGEKAGKGITGISRPVNFREAMRWKWLRAAGAVMVLSCFPFTACQAMYKCEQGYGAFSYQETPCAKDAQARPFTDSTLKAKNAPAGGAGASGAANAAPSPDVGGAGNAPAFSKLPPVENDVELDVPMGASPPDPSRPDDPRSRLTQVLLALSLIAFGWAYISWPFWVARWARYDGQSYIAWLLISWICSPLLGTLFLRMSDGPNMSPNRGKMWQRFALAGIFMSLSMLVLGWDVYREDSAFRHYGQTASVDPVSEYTLQTVMSTDRNGNKSVLLKRYIVDANFETADGRTIKASRALPEAQAVSLINGGSVGLTYLSNSPEKVRFDGEEHSSPARGMLLSLGLLVLSSLAWWIGKKGRAQAAETWRD